MSDRSSLVLAAVGTVTLVVATAGSAAVLAGTVAPGSSSPSITDTLVDPEPATGGATATHTVRVTLGDEMPADTGHYERVVLDYRAPPGANVSAVTADDVVRAGIDRRDELYRPEFGGGDDPGAHVDRNLTVTAVEPSADGTTLAVTFAGELDLYAEDELVLVVGSVRNPATARTATVGVTVESGAATLSGTGTVAYEPASATATPAPDGADGTVPPTDTGGPSCEP